MTAAEKIILRNQATIMTALSALCHQDGHVRECIMITTSVHSTLDALKKAEEEETRRGRRTTTP